MPPKKVVEQEKILFGRPGNTLQMGIVGMPNVGKSTTFNLLSKLTVPAENYPFCTIEPNKARVQVPDERFEKLCSMFKPKSKVSAFLQIVDIAGLVPGAHKGEGLGNAFLSHIREVDGIYHVVRAFEDPDITHTENEVDPVRDLGIIYKELIYKDLEYTEKLIQDKEAKVARMNDKQTKEQLELLIKVKQVLDEGKWIRAVEWTHKEVEELNKHQYLTAKQMVYLVNLSEADYKKKKNKWLPKIAEWIKKNLDGPMIPYSAEFERRAFEAELANNNNEESKDQKEIKMIETTFEGVPSQMHKIIKTGYKILELIYYFTAGEDEVKCWTVRERSKAPQAAGIIHTDFEKGFICAEVMKYEDFVRCGSEVNVKAEGKYRQQGKDYIVEDGDIIFFKFNVSQGGKKK